MEIAAAAAPRPQLIIGATGDWTRATMEVEGPAVAGIYKLLGAEEKLNYQRFEAPHNYNLQSREAMYEWLGRRLLEHPEAVSFKEAPYQKEPDDALRVFPGKLPDDALSMEEFIKARKQAQRNHWKQLVPRDQAALERFRTELFPAWRHTLQTDWTPAERDKKSPPPAEWVAREQVEGTVLIKVTGDLAVDPDKLQIERRDGVTVMTFKGAAEDAVADEISNHFTTYNRTSLQKQVGALITVCQMLRELPAVDRVLLSGSGRGSLWSMLAAPAADGLAVDCSALDFSLDENFLGPGTFAPGLRRIGTYKGAAMLAAPNPLLLHHTGGKFACFDIGAAYRAADAEDRLELAEAPLSEVDLLRWAAQK
jgi:hypothetical protein